MRTQAHKVSRGGRAGLKKARSNPHVEKLEDRLSKWGAKLDELVANAEKAGVGARSEYRKGVAELKSRYRDAEARVEELRTAGSEKWDTVKDGVESAWSELEAAFKKLKK